MSDTHLLSSLQLWLSSSPCLFLSRLHHGKRLAFITVFLGKMNKAASRKLVIRNHQKGTIIRKAMIQTSPSSFTNLVSAQNYITAKTHLNGNREKDGGKFCSLSWSYTADSSICWWEQHDTRGYSVTAVSPMCATWVMSNSGPASYMCCMKEVF